MLFTCSEKCQGGQLFVTGNEQLSGYLWTEARDVCRLTNATLPLGSRWPLKPGNHECYTSLFQKLSVKGGGNAILWSDACSTDGTQCGRFVIFHQFHEFDKYDTTSIANTRSSITRVVCQQGKTIHYELGNSSDEYIWPLTHCSITITSNHSSSYNTDADHMYRTHINGNNL